MDARADLLRDLRKEIGDKLGHDLRALATDAEGALHCAWPTMFRMVLDILEWEDEDASIDVPAEVAR